MENEPDNIRNELEASVVAVNKYLETRATRMTIPELLANMHPLDAEYFERVHRI